MRLTLQITAGAQTGRKIHLRHGQVAQFGRTEWADFSFPRDQEMADIHFQVECRPQGASVRRLQASGPIWLNDQETTQSELKAGDRIRAGSTTLLVVFDGEQGSVTAVTNVAATGLLAGAAAVDDVPRERTPLELCDELDLNDDARGVAAVRATAADFQQALEAEQQYMAALRLQAHRLPVREAVWWGTDCAEPLGARDYPPAERAAFDAARAWAEEPDEDRRRAAEAAAAATKYELPGSWLATAAYWSGNLAPPGVDEVLPDARLPGGAVTSALMIAAYHGNPLEAQSRFQQFLARAKKIAEHGIPVRRSTT